MPTAVAVAIGAGSSEPPQPDNARAPLANNSAVAARLNWRFTLDLQDAAHGVFSQAKLTVQDIYDRPIQQLSVPLHSWHLLRMEAVYLRAV